LPSAQVRSQNLERNALNSKKYYFALKIALNLLYCRFIASKEKQVTRRAAALGSDTVAALAVFGAQVKASRAAKKLTASELGARAGVSPRTVTAIERGNPNSTLGNAIEVALAAGVDLFGVSGQTALEELAGTYRQTATLLPQRIRKPRTASKETDLDF